MGGKDPRTTTERGLGYRHQRLRKAMLAEMVPGTLCPRCGQPMWPQQALDLDHVIPRAQGGSGGPARLAHAACNRAHGAEMTNAARTPPHYCTYDSCHLDPAVCACGRHSRGW